MLISSVFRLAPVVVSSRARRPVSVRRTLGVATAVTVVAGLVVPLTASADHAPGAAVTVLSAPASQTFTPDGDGVEDTVTVRTELVEPSTVTYRLEDPSGGVLVPDTEVATVLEPAAGWVAPFTWNGGDEPVGAYQLFWTAEGGVDHGTAQGVATLEITDVVAPTATITAPAAGAALKAGDKVSLHLSGPGCAPDPGDLQECRAVGGALETSEGVPFSGSSSSTDVSTFLDVETSAEPGNVPDGDVQVVGIVYWQDVWGHQHEARTSPRTYAVSSQDSLDVTSSPAVVYPNASPDWFAASTARVTYTLGRTTAVTLDVLDAAGAVVAQAESAGLPRAGENTAFWGGRTTAGGPAPEGEYTVRVSAVQEGAADLVDTVAVTVEHEVPTVTMTPADGTAVSGPVEVAVEAAGGLSIVSVQLNGEDGDGVFGGLLFVSDPQGGDLGPRVSATADPTRTFDGATRIQPFVLLRDQLGNTLAGPELGRTWQVTGAMTVTGTTSPFTLVPGGATPAVATDFTTSRNGTVRVHVRSMLGQVVRQLEVDSPVEAGQPRQVVWDGRDDAGRLVPAGDYALQVVATQETGATSFTGSLSRTVTVVRTVDVQITAPASGAEIFGPTQATISAPDGYGIDFATLIARVDASNGTVLGTADGWDEAPQSVSVSFNADSLPPGPHAVYARVTARELGAGSTTVITQDVTWTVLPKVVVEMPLEEAYVAPGGDSSDDTVALPWTLNRAAPLTAVLKNDDGEPVGTLVDAVDQPAGNGELVFDGSVGGVPLPTGTYVLEVTAGSSEPATRTVVIDRTALPAPTFVPTVSDGPLPDAEGYVVVSWTPPAGLTIMSSPELQSGGEWLGQLSSTYLEDGSYQAWLDTDRLGDGTHEVRVAATVDGPFGERDHVSSPASLIVDNGLELTEQYAPDDPFDPEDPLEDDWEMTVYANQPATVAWSIERAGTVVRTGSTALGYNASGRIGWDGRDAAGVPVPDGDYVLSLEASAPADPTQVVEGTDVPIVVDRTRPGTLTSPAAGATVVDGERLVFTPSPAGSDIDVLHVTPDGGSTSWTLTKQLDGTFAGTADLSRLPDGAYDLAVRVSWTDAQDRARWTGVAGPTVTLRHERLLTTAPAKTAGYLIVHDEGTDGGQSRSYEDALRLAREAQVSVTVLRDDAVVATPRSAALTQPGEVGVGWDGTVDGAPAAAGRYVLRITATDVVVGSDTRDVPIDVMSDLPAVLSGMPAGDASGRISPAAVPASRVELRSGSLQLTTDGRFARTVNGVPGATSVSFPMDTTQVDNGLYSVTGWVNWVDALGSWHSTALPALPLSIDNGMAFTGVPAPRTIVPGTPDGTYVGQFSLSQNAPVVVTVTDEQNEVVRTIETSGDRWLSSFSWDGTDGTEGAEPVEDGLYTLTMVATDPYRGTTATEEVQVGVARGVPGLITSPGAGSLLTGGVMVVWEHSHAAGVKSVDRVQVSARNMLPVTLVTSDIGDLAKTIDTKQLVNGGDRLTISVDWTDQADSPHRYVTWVDVVPSNPVEIALTSAPRAFSPDGNGVPERFEMTYTSTSCQRVVGIVVDAADEQVRQLGSAEGSVTCPGRTGGFSWDGRDDSGELVPDGQYDVVAVAPLVGGEQTGARVSTRVERDPVATVDLVDGAVVSDSLPLTVTPNPAFTAGNVTGVQVGVPGRTTLTSLTSGSDGAWTGALDLPATLTGQLDVELRIAWLDEFDQPHTAVHRRSVSTDETTLTLDALALSERGEAPYAFEVQIDSTALAGPISWRLDPDVDGEPVQTGSSPSPLSTVLEIAYLEPGSYAPLVEVFDVHGNRRHLSIDVTVDPPANRRPTLELGEPSRTKGVASEAHPFEVTIPVQATDSDGSVEKLLVDWGDGPRQEVAGDTRVLSHSYTEGGGFTVHVTAVDDDGASTGEQATLTVDDDVPLTARSSAAGTTSVTVDGEAVEFDATGSQPVAAISGYTWTFSDGTTLEGERVEHAFDEPGDHTATLTITRDDGVTPATTTYTQPVKVLPKGDTSVSTVTVVGGSGATVAYVDGNGTTQTRKTVDGKAVLYGLPEGDSTVSAFATGFRATDGTVTVEDGVGAGTVTLESGALAEAEIGVTRMTLQQVKDAGINPDDIGNKTVFQLKISIPYMVQGEQRQYDVDAYQAGPDLFDPTWKDPDEERGGCKQKTNDGRIVQIVCRGGGGGGGPTVQITPTEQGGEPQLMLLALSADASMLKEFFNVDMTVRNLSTSSLARITDGVATLELGSGLTLAPTSTAQDLRQDVDDIASGSESSASWIIRGDEAGDSSVSASFRGKLAPYGAPVEIDAEPAPVKVYGAGAVQVIVQASPTLVKDRPFVIRMGLKNVTKDADVYNATLTLQEESDWVSVVAQQPQARKERIAPGETWFAPDWQFLSTKDAELDLSKLPEGAIARVAAAGQLPPPPPVDGSQDVIEALAPAEDPAKQALFLRQTTSSSGLLSLDWDAVEGATDYQVMQSQPGRAGYVPVGEPVKGTRLDVPVADAFPEPVAARAMTRSAGMRAFAAEAPEPVKLVVASTVNGSSVIRHNQVHATPPYVSTTVSVGNWTLKGEVNETADGWLVKGSAQLNGLVLTPVGDTRLELNRNTKTLRSSGRVVLGVTLNGRTTDLGELDAFTWSLTSAIGVRVVDAVLLGLAVTDAVEGASNVSLSAPAPGKLELKAALEPPPLVAAAPAQATLLLDNAGTVTVEDAEVRWPDATFGALGRGDVELALAGAGASWTVTGALRSASGDGTLSGELQYDEAGDLTTGSFKAEHIAPFGLVGVDVLDVVASDGGASWCVSGSGGGESVEGSFSTDPKTREITDGSLSASRLTVPGLTTFETFSAGFDGSSWNLRAAKPELSGSLTVTDGVISGGTLTATELPVAGLLTADSLALAYDRATAAYSAEGTFRAAGGTDTVTGGVRISEGALDDVDLTGDRLALGPLAVRTPTIAWSKAADTWSVSGATTTLGTLISVSSFRAERTGTPAGTSTWKLSGATGAGAVSGSLVTDAAGEVTDGDIASTRLQVGLVDLPDFALKKSGGTWSGSSGAGETLSEFSFTYDEAGTLTAGRVHSASMDVVGLGTVTGFTYGFTDGTWTVSSTAPVFSGSLTLEDGVVDSGDLHAEDLPVLGLFTAKAFDLDYSAADASYSGAVALDLAGQEGVATVTVVVRNGAVQSLDLGLPDMALLDLASASGVHLTWSDTGRISVTAEKASIPGLVSITGFELSRDSDREPLHLKGDYVAPGTRGHVEADLTLVDGEVQTGAVTFQALSIGGLVPIGDVTLERRDGGWGLGVTGAPLFLDVRDGVLKGGHVGLPKVDLAGVFTMAGVDLDFDGTTWAGTIDGPSLEHGLDASFAYDDEGLVSGSFDGSVPLVSGWGLRSIQAEYARDTDTWSGGAVLDLPNGTIGADLTIEKGQLKAIHVEGSADAPIAPNVTLTGVTADLALKPFLLKGSATFGLGPSVQGKHLASSTGAFEISSDDAGRSSWKASADIRVNGLPLEAGATLGYQHPQGTATIAGRFSAGPPAANVSAQIGATFTPASGTFTATATGSIAFLGNTGQGTVALTERGYGGCFAMAVLGGTMQGGFFQPWSGARQDFGGCDSAPFAAVAPAGDELTAMTIRTKRLSVRATPASGDFVLAPGRENAVLRFVGADSAPDVVVRDPAGVARGTALQAEDQRTTYVVLTRPVGGTWTWSGDQALGAPLAASLPLPEPQVQAAAPTAPVDGQQTLAVTLTPLPGQEVRFFLRGPDGSLLHIGTSAARSDSLTFAAPTVDGDYTVVAQVMQGDLPRRTLELTTFRVGAAQEPETPGDGGGTATPTPTGTASPMPTATAGPTPTRSATPKPTGSPTPEPTPEPTGTATPTAPPGGTPQARAVDDSCPTGQVPTAQFPDVAPGDTHAGTISCVAWYALAAGYADGRFGPLDSVNRGQMASFIARLVLRAGGTLPADPPDAFRDDDGSAHEHAIDQLAAVGIVLGRADGSYGPGDLVHRAAMASYLVRAYRTITGNSLPVGTASFPDVDGLTQEDDIRRAATAGLTGGVTPERYDPAGSTQRGQMATFLARLLDLLVEEGFTAPPA